MNFEKTPLYIEDYRDQLWQTFEICKLSSSQATNISWKLLQCSSIQICSLVYQLNDFVIATLIHLHSETFPKKKEGRKFVQSLRACFPFLHR